MDSNLSGINVGGVKASIVTGLVEENHLWEYKGYHLRNPIKSARLIGVDNKELFAVALQADFEDRFAVAIYVDGVNVIQSKGIEQLEDVIIEQDIDHHYHFVCNSDYLGEINYVDRFDQASGANREFAFTFNPKKSVNINLINKVNARSKIELFMWKERPVKKVVMRSLSMLPNEESYVGAGAATNKAYGTGKNLSNPLFLGSATFVHVPASFLRHLGTRFVMPEIVNKVGKVDPMDVVPEV